MHLLTKILKYATLIAVVVIGGGIYYIQTEYAGIGLPWESSVDLPDFPQLPSPDSELQANQQGVIYFPSKSPYSLQRALTDMNNAVPTTGMGTLYLPENASAENPVPLMIILHGSGGIREDREHTYAKWFNTLGIAGFVLDYYSVRGVTPETKYLYKTLSASDIDIVTDAYSALAYLGKHPAIDANRVGVTGYSYGGMATRYTLDPRLKAAIAPDVPPFALHISVYGPCFQRTGSEQTTGAPYLAIYGDEDNSVDPADCDKLHANLRAGGSEVEALLLKGAGHGWENEVERKEYDYPFVRNCEFSYTTDTIEPTINGKKTAFPGLTASRGELAFHRVSVHMQAPECLGKGYIIGRDIPNDEKSHAAMQAFMERIFFNESRN